MARPRYKRPMRQSALDMSSEVSDAELAALKALLGSARLAGAHLEVGTAAGGTLKELMLCYAPPRPPFIVVDSFRYFPNQKDIVANNLRGAGIDPAAVDMRATDSAAALAAADARGEQFDFIFIDANHDARHVIADLRWARLLKPGGYLCLHDYGPKFPGVTWATDRFLKNNRNYRRVSLTDSLVVIQKSDNGQGEEVGAGDILLGRVLTLLHKFRRSIRKRLNRAA
jgi:predicted O-methyltransferase YrrM